MQRRRAIAFLCTVVLLAAPATAFADTSFATLLSQYEQEYQLPSGILWKVALAESGGNPNVCASTSSACGMFQFIVSTWETDTKALYGQPLSPSLRTNPDISARAAAYELATIKSQIGSLITQANVNLSAGLYLGHFLGSGGARTLLTAYMQNPGQSACALLPPQCASNRSIMASQTVSGLINWAAQKMSVSGVPNIAGNFQCANGTSYAYSYCDVGASNFLPVNTVIPANPYGQYATVFPSVGSAPISPAAASPIAIPSAPQNPLPANYTPAQTQPATTAASPAPAASGTSACTPQYYCSNNTVYYESDSCATSTFEQCTYGCSGTICAPGPAASSSPPAADSQPVSDVATPVLGTFGTASVSFFATSTEIGTGTSPAGGDLFSIVDVATATPIDATSIASGSSGTSAFEGEPLVSTGFSQSQNVYIPAPASPFEQILGQLKTALSGLLNYLQSL